MHLHLTAARSPGARVRRLLRENSLCQRENNSRMILLFKGQNCPDGFKIQKTKSKVQQILLPNFILLLGFMIQLLEERCKPLTRGNVSSLPQIYFTFSSGEEPIEIIQKREVPSK